MMIRTLDTGPCAASATCATLSLLHAALGAPPLVAIALRGADGWLSVLEAAGPSPPPTAMLDARELDDAPGFQPVAARRLSSAWSLACAGRPERIALRRVATTPWWLVVGHTSPALPQPVNMATDVAHLDAACSALAGVYHSGALAGAERAAARRMEALIACLDDPVLFMAADGGQDFLNPAARAWLRLPPGEIAPSTLAQAMRRLQPSAPGDVQPALTHEAPALASTWRFTDGGRLWEGRSRRVDVLGLRGRLWAFRDVTELQQRERALMEGLRSETVGRLTAGMAHQFNNLLTVILGHADSLAREAALNARAGAQIADLTRAAERGAEIIQQLLAYGSRAREAAQRVDLAAEISRLLPIVRRLLPDSVAIVTRGLDRPTPAECERHLLEDALMHLVLNARDAMPGGGTLTIALEGDLPPAKDAAGMPMARVRVTDDGIGMTPEVQAHAFDPFFTTKGMAEARGLGLSIVSGLVRRCGGAVRLSSEPGRGTAVELTLPLASGGG